MTVMLYVVSIDTPNSSEVAAKWMVCLPTGSGVTSR